MRIHTARGTFGYVHGRCDTRLYRTWANMIQRCTNPKQANYRYYGAKGIRVCDEWRRDFLTFERWALRDGYTDRLQIHRNNNSGDYEPSNCVWVTAEKHAWLTWRAG